jgi:hypothetical protein
VAEHHAGADADGGEAGLERPVRNRHLLDLPGHDLIITIITHYSFNTLSSMMSGDSARMASRAAGGGALSRWMRVVRPAVDDAALLQPITVGGERLALLRPAQHASRTGPAQHRASWRITSGGSSKVSSSPLSMRSGSRSRRSQEQVEVEKETGGRTR